MRPAICLIVFAIFLLNGQEAVDGNVFDAFSEAILVPRLNEIQPRSASSPTDSISLTYLSPPPQQQQAKTADAPSYSHQSWNLNRAFDFSNQDPTYRKPVNADYQYQQWPSFSTPLKIQQQQQQQPRYYIQPKATPSFPSPSITSGYNQNPSSLWYLQPAAPAPTFLEQPVAAPAQSSSSASPSSFFPQSPSNNVGGGFFNFFGGAPFQQQQPSFFGQQQPPAQSQMYQQLRPQYQQAQPPVQSSLPYLRPPQQQQPQPQQPQQQQAQPFYNYQTNNNNNNNNYFDTFRSPIFSRNPSMMPFNNRGGGFGLFNW